MSDSGFFMSEHDESRAREIHDGMLADGIKPYETVIVDLFAPAPDAVTKIDSVQFVAHKVLTEGDRKRYMKAVNRDLKIQKGTGDAIMRMAAGEDRTALLTVAITGWNILRDGQPWPFNPKNLSWFVENGPVKILEKIEDDIKRNNPWLYGDMTVEDIDQEIERLQELRVEIEAREEGKLDSAN